MEDEKTCIPTSSRNEPSRPEAPSRSRRAGRDEAAPAAEPQSRAAEAPAAEPAEAPAAPAYDESSPKKWFIIHTYSGFENKVAESLRSRAEAFGFADKIGQILIPTEEVVELRNGKKVTSKRLVYPGYVLVEMEMNDELWHAVKSTPRVTGFVGGGTQPVPLSADEVNQILYRQASSAERPRPKMTFEKNDCGAHRRRSVRQLLGQGGRGQSRARHAARDGDDFRPRHAGGAGVPPGRKRIER